MAKKDGKEYALKETLSSGRKATKAAQRESKLMVELDHINIVKLYEYFTFGHPAKCFMIMVWFPLNQPLSGHIQTGLNDGVSGVMIPVKGYHWNQR